MAVDDSAVLKPPLRMPRLPLKAAGLVVAAALVALTLARFGASGSGAAWAAVQLLLVYVACVDIATRRIPNRVTLPAAAIVLALRAVFAGGTVVEAVVAGAAGFGAFFLLALITRGGFGMGDVKLAGLLGLLLGATLLPALFIGVVAGGLASVAVLAARRDGRGHTIAYGPYLCLGAAIAILALHPLHLV